MNRYLSFEHVSFSYAESVKPLFSDISIQFSEGWTAITGPNGGGKSTLLKLACGVFAPDSGVVNKSAVSCLYCAQDAILPEDWQIFFWSNESETRRIFSLLRIEDDFPDRWTTLSGGEKKRLQVALALCENPAVLALDEPTNHLDAASSDFIASALHEYGGIGLLVSHSRALMDSLCPQTFYVSLNERRLYSCSVSEALAQRELNRTAAQNIWNTAQTTVKNTRRQVQHWAEETAKSTGRMSKSRLNKNDSDSRNKINLARLTGKDAVASNTKSRIGSKLAHNQAKLDLLEKPLSRKNGITLESTRFACDYMCSLSAEILYPKTEFKGQGSTLNKKSYAFSIPDIFITPTSRIALTGENGSGKTLLIRRILFALGYDDSGALPITQNGVVYIPQEITMELENSYLNAFFDLNDAQKGAILSQIYRLGSEPISFLPQTRTQTVTVSPGELRKLVIALALQTGASFLILDEPTNHLDLESILLLETALRDSECALLLCSHDEYFIQALTTETWCAERTGAYCGRLVFR